MDIQERLSLPNSPPLLLISFVVIAILLGWGKFPQNNILTIFFRQFLKHLFQDVPLWMLANETE
jgi:hypothetical protein